MREGGLNIWGHASLVVHAPVHPNASKNDLAHGGAFESLDNVFLGLM